MRPVARHMVDSLILLARAQTQALQILADVSWAPHHGLRSAELASTCHPPSSSCEADVGDRHRRPPPSISSGASGGLGCPTGAAYAGHERLPHRRVTLMTAAAGARATTQASTSSRVPLERVCAGRRASAGDFNLANASRGSSWRSSSCAIGQSLLISPHTV